MTYDEFRRHLGKAGLTLHEFAQILKMNPISLSNYGQRGTVPSHLAIIACLVGEMAEHQIDYKTPLERIAISSKKRRGNPYKFQEKSLNRS